MGIKEWSPHGRRAAALQQADWLVQVPRGALQSISWGHSPWQAQPLCKEVLSGGTGGVAGCWGFSLSAWDLGGAAAVLREAHGGLRGLPSQGLGFSA